MNPFEETIPPEIQARVEANAFFDALLVGDYGEAARAQERLRAFGWDVSRASAKKPARKTLRASREATQ
jgi:hypothetical protein